MSEVSQPWAIDQAGGVDGSGRRPPIQSLPSFQPTPAMASRFLSLRFLLPSVAPVTLSLLVIGWMEVAWVEAGRMKEMKHGRSNLDMVWCSFLFFFSLCRRNGGIKVCCKI